MYVVVSCSSRFLSLQYGVGLLQFSIFVSVFFFSFSFFLFCLEDATELCVFPCEESTRFPFLCAELFYAVECYCKWQL